MYNRTRTSSSAQEHRAPLARERKRRDKLACRARRKRILHKQGFSRPQVSRILEQIQAVEEEHAADKQRRVAAGDDDDNQHHDSETREQNSLGGARVQLLFREDRRALEILLHNQVQKGTAFVGSGDPVEDEDGNGTSTTTAVVGGSTSSARVRDLMRILEGMEHEYTFEQYVEAMTTGIPEGLGFSDAYAREVASVLMTFEGQTDERDEDEVVVMEDQHAQAIPAPRTREDADAVANANLTFPQEFRAVSFRELLRGKIAEQQARAEVLPIIDCLHICIAFHHLPTS